MDRKQIGKAIQKSAKRVIVESGISSSRSGSKELSHLATKLSTQPISSIEAANGLGQQLGTKIVELSQSLNKPYLDKGVVRTLIRTKAVPSINDLPAGVQANTSKDSLASKATSTAPASPPQSAKPAPQASSATQSGVSAPAQPIPPSQVNRPPVVEDDISLTDSASIEDDGIEEENIALQSASTAIAEDDIEDDEEDIEDENDTLQGVSTSVADEDIEEEDIEEEDIEDGEDDIAPAKSATTVDDAPEEDDEALDPTEDAVKTV